ncbi:hypothetical protein BH09ACT6_BH09ACT6_23840 [soil metagenome]
MESLRQRQVPQPGCRDVAEELLTPQAWKVGAAQVFNRGDLGAYCAHAVKRPDQVGAVDSVLAYSESTGISDRKGPLLEFRRQWTVLGHATVSPLAPRSSLNYPQGGAPRT